MRFQTTQIGSFNSLRKGRPWAGSPSLDILKPSTKAHIQILRKLFHTGMTLFMIFLFAFVVTDPKAALLTIIFAGGPFVFCDLARLKSPTLNKYIIFVFGPLMRRRELLSVSAMTPFLIASTIVIAFFPKPIALLSLMCLGLGDVAACMVGLKYGKDKLINGKSLQGSLACFLVCFTVTLLFLLMYQITTQYAFLICFIGGLAPTLGELISSKNLDDNFTIPVVTASVMYPTLLLLAGF